MLLPLSMLLGCRSPAPPPPPIIGLCDAFDQDRLEGPDSLSGFGQELDTLQELGITLARPHRPNGHVFSPSFVDPKGGTGLDWSLPDLAVSMAGERGVSLFATLDPHTQRGPMEGPAPTAFVPDDALDRWAGFVRAAVERYDGDGHDDMPGLTHPIKAWEVGNEPWCPVEDEPCQQRYTDLVRVSHQAAHAADPTTTVLPGGAAFLLHNDGTRHGPPEALFRYFFAHGGEAWTDVFSFHLMVGAADPTLDEHLAGWREFVPAHLPVWLTETGVHNLQGHPFISKDPAKAAEWLDEQLHQAGQLGIERVFFCQVKRPLRDTPALAKVLQRAVSVRP